MLARMISSFLGATSDFAESCHVYPSLDVACSSSTLPAVFMRGIWRQDAEERQGGLHGVHPAQVLVTARGLHEMASCSPFAQNVA